MASVNSIGPVAIPTSGYIADDQTTKSMKQSVRVRVREKCGEHGENGHSEESSGRLWGSNKGSPKSNLKEPNSTYWAMIINPTELMAERMKFKRKNKK